jgi:hypothetical protein
MLTEKEGEKVIGYFGPVWQGSSPAPAPTPAEEPCKRFPGGAVFSVKRIGAGAVVAPSKRLRLLWRSPSRGAVLSTPFI